MCRKRECEGRWAKPTNGQLKGMLGNARGGSEKREENQKITAAWKPRGENFQELEVCDPPRTAAMGVPDVMLSLLPRHFLQFLQERHRKALTWTDQAEP